MFLVEDFRAGRGVVGRLTQVRLPRKALLFSSAGAIGLLAFAAPALADQSYCMTSGDVSVLSCHTAKVDVRATTGETSLTVEGLTIDGEDSINFTTANGATGPLAMELIVNDTSVNTAIYGGVNVYSGLANTDIDVTLGEDVTLTAGEHSARWLARHLLCWQSLRPVARSWPEAGLQLQLLILSVEKGAPLRLRRPFLCLRLAGL